MTSKSNDRQAAKDSKRGARAAGRQLSATAAKWIDGEDVVGVLVSATPTETRHGVRCLVTVERSDTGEHEARWMPSAWADKLAGLTGQRIGIARDGEGMAARYDVRVLD